MSYVFTGVRPSLSSPVVFVALERIINEHLIAPIGSGSTTAKLFGQYGRCEVFVKSNYNVHLQGVRA